MPSKAQATQLPTFGAFKKFETHLQNRLPSSTKNHYREEERNSGVFLKACDESASQLNPDRDKLFSFPENNFFQKISQCKKSSPIFTFGESIVARAALEFLPGKGLCSNSHPRCVRDRGTSPWRLRESCQFGAARFFGIWKFSRFRTGVFRDCCDSAFIAKLCWRESCDFPFPNFHIIGLPVW